MRAPTSDESEGGKARSGKVSRTVGHGGRRPGAGRPKGSTKLLPEQQLDIFFYIEERCEQREKSRRFGDRRVVRSVCKWIAKNVSFRWIAGRRIDAIADAARGSGRTVAISDRYSARALENIYYAVKRRFRDARWELEYDSDRTLVRSGPADRSPEPRRTTLMIVDRRRSR